MIKIFWDLKSHQAVRQLGTEQDVYNEPSSEDWKGKRLTGFSTALNDAGYELEMVHLKHGLDEAGILIISGRHQSVPFDKAETEAIVRFCADGGGLLMMANQQGFVRPQQEIAKALELPIEFEENRAGRQLIMLCRDHPTSRNCAEGLSIRTGCRMQVQPIPGVTLLADARSPDLGDFAVALERVGKVRRRAVVMSSDGHIASRDDNHRDMWEVESNKTWTMNLIGWLAEEPTA